MVIEAIGIEPYEYIPSEEEGEEVKTSFLLYPLTMFESMKYGGLFQKLISGGSEDEEDFGSIVDAFSTEEGEHFAREFSKFIKIKVKEIRNIKIEGTVKTISGEEINPDIIPFSVAFELFSDAIARANTTKEEEKN